MSSGITFVGPLFCGVAVVALFVTIYFHLEGNRLSAIIFVFRDIRRDMKRYPLYQVWWRALRIAMGRRKHRPAQAFARDNVTTISRGQYKKRA